MKYDRWEIAPACPERRAALEQDGYSPLLAAVLSARGEQAILPHAAPEPLLSPFLMRDMDKAAQRVKQALARGETIAVYGDYDVDGITSTCLLTDYLLCKGGRVISYIPDRLEEGYGLNLNAIDDLKARGAQLIITVDCGITNVEEVAHANELGIDVVITDHHECKQILPDACALVDPHRPDCPYPFKGLAGVGVALKLACAVEGESEQVLRTFGDLAAVGTVADVMPMLGENRNIVRRGLEVLSRTPRLGFALLLREAGLEGKALTSVSVGYTLAPRLNAAGRMGRVELALELLLTQNPPRGAELARALCDLNRQRQSIEGEIFEACVAQLERTGQQGAIVLADEHWHQGVVGIVASRLAERYSCPTFMICLSEDGLGKGSCRSWGGINLFRLLDACADCLESFGGHAMAAGFVVRRENIPQLRRRLQSLAQAELEGEAARSVLEADAVVQPDELTLQNVTALDELEPCGLGNPRPVLVLIGATIRLITPIGHGKHLRLRFEARETLLDAVWFSPGQAQQGLAAGMRVDVAFYPQVNEFRGPPTVQLQVQDIRPALTRAQSERAILEKYTLGSPLTQEEARVLLPSREEFAGLWRYLRQQCAGRGQMEDSMQRLAHGAARLSGLRGILVRTQVCLEVLEERGLIRMRQERDSRVIVLNSPEHKINLEESPIMQRLRRQAQGTQGKR